MQLRIWGFLPRGWKNKEVVLKKNDYIRGED